ncbi:hypothetical protein [Qipengyuania sp.]|uniref:hypothetical protein n=1 Tax=Qipengyuania sp. TaxID=2004515 RepID=UPI0035C79FDB
MRYPILLVALLPLASPALAQTSGSATGSDLARAKQALTDPARQEALARSLGVMTEVLLDLPLAPLVAPLAEAAGEDREGIDPDMTLRKIAPDAGRIPQEIESNLPRAMTATAGMSEAVASALPQLEALARTLQQALPPERP